MSLRPPDPETDYFRESNPDRRERTLAEILNEIPVPAGPPASPGSKDLQCVLCHLWFTAEAQLFRGRWIYPNMCDPNCSGQFGAIPQPVIDKCEPGRTRNFYCAKCGIEKAVEPELFGGVWEYRCQCSNCGYVSVNLYHLQKKCGSCGKRITVTSRNPNAKCKCEGGPERPF